MAHRRSMARDRVPVAPAPAALSSWEALSLAGVRVALVVAALLFLWRLASRLALFVQFSAAFLRWPWVIDRDEGVSVNSAYMLAQGRNIYGFDPDGFIATPYPPILSIVGALLPRSADFGLLGGRLFSLLSTLAIAGLAAALVSREWRSRLAGVVAGALFLALGPTILWASLYKQDMPALAFGLAGLAWLARWPAGHLAYGAIPWFVLAFYTKQTAVTAPAAAIVYLLWRDWRFGLRFALASAAAFAAPLAALELVTRHGFWTHVVTYHAFPWQQERFLKNLRQFVAFHRLLLPLAALGLACVIRARRPSLVGLYAAFGLTSLIGNGTIGANANHLLEALLVCCLLVGVLVSRCAVAWRRPAPAAALLAALVILTAQLPALGAPAEWYDRKYFPSAQRADRLAQLATMIGQQPGEVFCDDNYLLLRAGKTPRYQDIASMGPLASAGLWDASPLVRDLRARRFSMLVLSEEVTRPGYTSTSWPPEVLAALREHYRLLYRDIMFTYVPK